MMMMMMMMLMVMMLMVMMLMVMMLWMLLLPRRSAWRDHCVIRSHDGPGAVM